MRLLIFWLLVLSACTSHASQPMPQIPPGEYPDYRSYIEADIYNRLDPATPEAVRSSYANCISIYVIQHVALADKDRLDAYARGNAQMTEAEMRALDKQLTDREGARMTKEKLSELGPICPESIGDFRTYMFK